MSKRITRPDADSNSKRQADSTAIDTSAIIEPHQIEVRKKSPTRQNRLKKLRNDGRIRPKQIEMNPPRQNTCEHHQRTGLFRARRNTPRPADAAFGDPLLAACTVPLQVTHRKKWE